MIDFFLKKLLIKKQVKLILLKHLSGFIAILFLEILCFFNTLFSLVKKNLKKINDYQKDKQKEL